MTFTTFVVVLRQRQRHKARILLDGQGEIIVLSARATQISVHFVAVLEAPNLEALSYDLVVSLHL